MNGMFCDWFTGAAWVVEFMEQSGISSQLQLPNL